MHAHENLIQDFLWTPSVSLTYSNNFILFESLIRYGHFSIPKMKKQFMCIHGHKSMSRYDSALLLLLTGICTIYPQCEFHDFITIYRKVSDFKIVES